MAVSPEFRAFVEDQIGRVAPVRSRPMFGGLGLYSADLFFGIVDDDVVYFRVDDATRPRYVKRGMKAFDPMGTPMNGYWQVPPDVIEDADELASWVQEALEVVERVGKKPKRRKSGAKKKGRR
ncbi:MAG TPA: TfoX/Sxy family protein [Gemmatimonadota bacterium]|nr:TfoX/Sxy family protein [Gemmatimonadota bacterium]